MKEEWDLVEVSHEEFASRIEACKDVVSDATFDLLDEATMVVHYYDEEDKAYLGTAKASEDGIVYLIPDLLDGC